jgi:hypothetical protein
MTGLPLGRRINARVQVPGSIFLNRWSAILPSVTTDSTQNILRKPERFGHQKRIWRKMNSLAASSGEAVAKELKI